MLTWKWLQILAGLSASVNALAAATTTVFMLDTSTKVTAVVSENRIFYHTEGKIKSSGSISIDTEKAVHLEVKDYNFDGINDMAIWYVDEGMGVYNIYRIFVYSKKKKTFLEQHPACGDEFINLRLNKQRRYLQSTYFDGSVPKICLTRIPK